MSIETTYAEYTLDAQVSLAEMDKKYAGVRDELEAYMQAEKEKILMD